MNVNFVERELELILIKRLATQITVSFFTLAALHEPLAWLDTSRATLARLVTGTALDVEIQVILVFAVRAVKDLALFLGEGQISVPIVGRFEVKMVSCEVYYPPGGLVVLLHQFDYRIHVSMNEKSIDYLFRWVKVGVLGLFAGVCKLMQIRKCL